MDLSEKVAGRDAAILWQAVPVDVPRYLPPATAPENTVIR
jgi:hypothetical protein